MTTINRPGPMRVVAVLTAALLAGTVLTAADKRTAGERPPDALRCLDKHLMQVIDQGLARSVTLRNLVAHLQTSNVIVYVSLSSSLPSGTAGRTRLMTVAGGWRYLGIDLSDRLARTDLLMLLGHELQHAIEIADAPEVVDEASMVVLYQRLSSGHGDSGRHGDVKWFETEAAIATGRHVFAEIASWTW